MAPGSVKTSAFAVVVASHRTLEVHIVKCPLPPKLGFLGYTCERVFPAGVQVGLDAPSSEAADWLSSRFSRSFETRRRFGLLRIMFTRCASSELQFGALREVLMVARERQGGTVAESLVRGSSTRHPASKYQIRRGRRAARSSTSQGGAEPLCARIDGANREVSEGLTTVCFFPTRAKKERRTGKIPAALVEGRTGL